MELTRLLFRVPYHLFFPLEWSEWTSLDGNHRIRWVYTQQDVPLKTRLAIELQSGSKSLCVAARDAYDPFLVYCMSGVSSSLPRKIYRAAREWIKSLEAFGLPGHTMKTGKWDYDCASEDQYALLRFGAEGNLLWMLKHPSLYVVSIMLNMLQRERRNFLWNGTVRLSKGKYLELASVHVQRSRYRFVIGTLPNPSANWQCLGLENEDGTMVGSDRSFDDLRYVVPFCGTFLYQDGELIDLEREEQRTRQLLRELAGFQRGVSQTCH